MVHRTVITANCDQCGASVSVDSVNDLPRGWVAISSNQNAVAVQFNELVIRAKLERTFCSRECMSKWISEQVSDISEAVGRFERDTRPTNAIRTG